MKNETCSVKFRSKSSTAFSGVSSSSKLRQRRSSLFPKSPTFSDRVDLIKLSKTSRRELSQRKRISFH